MLDVRLSPASPGAEVHDRRWATLGVLCLSLTIVMMANVSLNLALPSIARGLDASAGSLQWMVDAYALVFAGLLFPAGALGDRFGRKGALQAGLALFLIGSVVASQAPRAGDLVASRALMGAAAAFVMPSTLSIITNVFPADERGRAIATWSGVSAGAAALGPIASGLLLDRFWWGSVFLINVPVALVALVLGARLVPSSRDPERRPVDVTGALLSTAAVAAVVFAIIEAPHGGWDSSSTHLAMAIAAVSLVLFLRWEAIVTHPMLDLSLFRVRHFSVGTGGIGLLYFTLFGTFFLLAQFLQLVMGLSALAAGLVQLPVSVIMITVAPQVPRLIEAHGARRVIPIGLFLVAGGAGLLAGADATTPVWFVVAALVPLSTGIAVSSAPLTTLVMAAVPSDRAGAGSAMNNVSRELGGALGVAVLGSAVASRYAVGVGAALDAVPSELRPEAEAGLAGALEVASALQPDAATGLVSAAQAGFIDGFGLAALVSASVAVLVGIGTARLLRDDSTEAA